MNAQRNQPSALAYQMVLILSIVVLVSAVGGLGLVWMRQQITDTASRIQKLQRDSVDVQRRLEYLDAKIAELLRPDVLSHRSMELGLGLTRPKASQIVHMGPLRLPPQMDLPVIDGPSEVAANDPFRTTFDLAVMEPLRARSR